jgi:hypothetical protein
MARSARRRLVTGLVLLLAAALPWIGGAPAHGAPRPPAPNAVTITGTGIPRPVTVRAEADPLLFAAVLDQVSWLTGVGHRALPAGVNLGPKYTVTVLINNAPVRTYDLYPLASGGPRAFRPAKQPGRRSVPAAWFFGRLTMPEALQAAGAPLSDRPDVGTGGIGGGARILAEQAADDGRQDVDALVSQFRGLLLLNLGVILMITAGLGGIALLVRRRTR